MTAIEAGALPSGRLEWRVAEVREIVIETPHVKSLLLHIEGWPGHRAGQHVDVRLTAEDGYQAQRSYSIASAPEDKLLSLTVERIADGEVSPYLVDDLHRGDKFQLRGPIGGYFVWTVDAGGPLFLVGGGSGIVPLMAMLRHRARKKASVSTLLVYSSRTLEDVIYRCELDSMAEEDPHLHVVHTLTRTQPEGWVGRRGRIDRNLLAEISPAASDKPHTFLCGPTSLVEDVSRLLVENGYDALAIKTERFGPTGG
jgi:ferredoxin-NADP reductase